MKKTLLFLTLLLITTITIYSQVKVVNSNLGIGTNIPTQRLHVLGNSFLNGNLGIDVATPAYKLDCKGEVRFSKWMDTWDEVVLNWNNQWGAPQLYCKSPNLLVGTSGFPVNVIYVNWFYYQNMYQTSDENLKENIQPLENTLTKLLGLEGKRYRYKSDDEKSVIPDFETKLEQETFGFLAQELEILFPELVDAPSDVSTHYSINYIGLIPVLVEAIKEQQNMIEVLQRSVESLEEDLMICCAQNLENSLEKGAKNNTRSLDISNYEEEQENMKLYQNAPNPFNELTTIQCYLPQTVRKAELCLYNMQGAQVKCLSISERGMVYMQIQAGQLSAGVYTYLLIGDGKTTDAKQMIITK